MYAYLVRHWCGRYADLCSPGEVLPCNRQSNALNLIYTVATVVQSGCGILVGIMLDKWGPRAAMLVGCAMQVGGCFLFASFVSPVVGYSLIAFGGMVGCMVGAPYSPVCHAHTTVMYAVLLA